MIHAVGWYLRGMTYVGVGRRFVAMFIDSVLLAHHVGAVRRDPARRGILADRVDGRHLFWPGLITIVYFVLLEGSPGATIGKFLTGIRVVNEDGTKLGWTGAVVRNVARVVDAFPYAFPYLVGAISVWASPTQQRTGRPLGQLGRRDEGVDVATRVA